MEEDVNNFNREIRNEQNGLTLPFQFGAWMLDSLLAFSRIFACRVDREK
jgi:hypothetical protein